jgi:hypothetical protein
MEKNNYFCEKCNLNFFNNSRFEKHIKTELHLIGKKKKRSDYKEPFKCEDCEYTTKNIVTLKVHKLNKHSSLEDREKEYTHYCKCCDYGSFSNDMYNIHIETIKHKYYSSKNKE